jgi:hypothetical protein
MLEAHQTSDVCSCVYTVMLIYYSMVVQMFLICWILLIFVLHCFHQTAHSHNTMHKGNYYYYYYYYCVLVKYFREMGIDWQYISYL